MLWGDVGSCLVKPSLRVNSRVRGLFLSSYMKTYTTFFGWVLILFLFILQGSCGFGVPLRASTQTLFLC